MRLSELLDEVRAKNAILCLSVQHTGTWFALNFLMEHKGTKGVVAQVKNIKTRDDILQDGIVHVHINGFGITSSGGRRTRTFKQTAAMTKGMRLIVPVRDPLLSLITRHKRHPDRKSFYIVDGFCHLSELDAVYLPVDCNTYDIHPYYLLEKVCKELGLEVNEFVEKWSIKWPIYNSKFDYGLKRAYQEGRIDKIAKAFPEEYQHLKENEKNIRPFLEKLGYKNLMWWS